MALFCPKCKTELLIEPLAPRTPGAYVYCTGCGSRVLTKIPAKAKPPSPPALPPSPEYQQWPDSGSQWYILRSGQVLGPYTSAKLKAMVETGRLKPDAPVRKGDDGPWTPARKIAGLTIRSGQPAPLDNQTIRQVETEPVVQLVEAEKFNVSNVLDQIPESSSLRPLRPCPDCESLISQNALQCPRCGKPFDRYRKPSTDPARHEERKTSSCTMGCAIIAALFFALIIGTCLFDGGNSRGRKSSGDNNTKINAYFMAKQFVTDRLKSPASAEFPSHPTSCVEATDGWHVKGYVDSQNSFGAMMRTQWTAVVRHKGGSNWQLVSLEMD
ncbi:MAG: DUF4339 domain-containing protein [Planctomycetes bacterium]|nr:DUF4339 domain-containing protein [Planctomycetota bacterium]